MQKLNLIKNQYGGVYEKRSIRGESSTMNKKHKDKINNMSKEELITKLTKAYNRHISLRKELSTEKNKITEEKVRRVVHFIFELGVLNKFHRDRILRETCGIMKAEKKLKIRTGISAEVHKYKDELNFVKDEKVGRE